MDKKTKMNLKALYDIIIAEAEENPKFASELSNVFGSEDLDYKPKNAKIKRNSSSRRDKAVLDPIKLAEEEKLTIEVLEPLSEKELKDIIADYGMDSSKLAMKWKDKSRLVQLILDTSFRRASKGDAFRS